MFVSAIVVAGGRGERLGADRPKQLLEIGGRSILQWSVSAFDAHPSVDEVVPVVSQAIRASVSIECRKAGDIAIGGERRQDSVAAGFALVSPDADIVLVHDAARPFVSAGVIARVIDAAAAHGAAVPAIRARDTVKRAPAAGAAILETLPRETIWLAQTPQGFRRDVLADAMRKTAGADVTDEAMMAERAGHPVHIVEGDEANAKITTAHDLARARARFPSELRVGNGYDLHRLVEGRRLVLAGVEIPFDKGPLGHSDGDVVCHALCDAMFGAAALGDIGRHFSNTDPRWKDTPGLDFVGSTRAILAQSGWRTTSADVTVILEQPKLAPFVRAIREALSGVLPGAAISIKAKTNEGVDAVGRGEAIAAHAVAVVTREGRA